MYFLTMEDPSNQAEGPSRVNQLGGCYINGKPLPTEIRHKIVAMASQGFRSCEISRRLQITHGCISKLLSKYRKTGSIEPGGEANVGRPRVISPRIGRTIDQYLKEQPKIHSREIRARLVQEKICTSENSPSLTSISRLLKNAEETRRNVFAVGVQQPSNTNSYSINRILNLPCKRESSSFTSSSTSSFPSLDSNVGEINNQQQTGHLSGLHEVEVSYPLQIQRRNRTKYTSNQQLELESAFAANRYPSASERDHLASKLGVAESRIQVWFSNRRMQSKRLKRKRRINETRLTEEEPKECSGRLNLDQYLTPRQLVGSGRSRIFFPPGYVTCEPHKRLQLCP